ncbi:Holliday junction branch migration protein RuvA [Thermovibrio ammonificans]|jgi:Holliday junction DNA helicase RuvA|uniref:Holliday junction branch migration complex subunit RuvA n=1 Tax=Thermovibrio ammonificans (strain DSM 15698 / JCM 12110 / HB-1) TaxID=648996 RepID=E8T4L5_THEA1|nr:Holliday junction branch migration protein RuvA [Thermovibrio ammonificans]ADU97473.1 Holliday junction DNA helicase RuvA [Thermovibrio ammonificans HB-1]
MVEAVSGTVSGKGDGAVFLSCGCFTLRLLVPERLLPELHEGTHVTLYTELLFPQEGAPQLFGFKTREERELFRQLMKVPKVGSRLALAVLSVFSPEEFVKVLEGEDVEALSKVPGLGRKLSRRLITELKGKLVSGEVPREVKEVLRRLGYTTAEINEALKGLNLTGVGVEEAVKEALKRLSGSLGDRETE